MVDYRIPGFADLYARYDQAAQRNSSTPSTEVDQLSTTDREVEPLPAEGAVDVPTGQMVIVRCDYT
jgi:hypothetical protein